SKRIPFGFNYANLYNPKKKYNALKLMSTKKRPGKTVRRKASPPRPPNLFFLFKNAFMLEFKRQFPQEFEKLSMPNLCKCTQELWGSLPSEVKAEYAKLADSPMSENMSTFSSTTLLEQLDSENSSSILSSEVPQITTPILATPTITSSATTSLINSPITTSLINSPITTSLINSPITTSLINSPITSSATTSLINSPITTSLINSPITPSEGSPLVPGPIFSQPCGSPLVMSPELFGFHLDGSHFIPPDASTLVLLLDGSIISGGALGIELPNSNSLDTINFIPSVSYDINYANYDNTSMPDRNYVDYNTVTVRP
ncbi:178_t:CDS:2, partial [Racocetra fulgida]